ncbi:MAG TPA: hypothetical protein VF541_05170, partial [Longimicrobium sp.]
MNPVAAAVAFFALGVTVFGSALLLLFNHRSTAVRWFVIFQCTIATWLAAQGWALASGDWARWGPVVSGAVHLAPALFLAFGLAARSTVPLGPAAPIALGLALLPLDLGLVDGRYAQPVLLAWNVGAWTLAIVLLVRGMTRRMRELGFAERQRRS